MQDGVPKPFQIYKGNNKIKDLIPLTAQGDIKELPKDYNLYYLGQSYKITEVLPEETLKKLAKTDKTVSEVLTNPEIKNLVYKVLNERCIHGIRYKNNAIVQKLNNGNTLLFLDIVNNNIIKTDMFVDCKDNKYKDFMFFKGEKANGETYLYFFNKNTGAYKRKMLDTFDQEKDVISKFINTKHSSELSKKDVAGIIDFCNNKNIVFDRVDSDGIRATNVKDNIEEMMTPKDFQQNKKKYQKNTNVKTINRMNTFGNIDDKLGCTKTKEEIKKRLEKIVNDIKNDAFYDKQIYTNQLSLMKEIIKNNLILKDDEKKELEKNINKIIKKMHNSIINNEQSQVKNGYTNLSLMMNAGSPIDKIYNQASKLNNFVLQSTKLNYQQKIKYFKEISKLVNKLPLRPLYYNPYNNPMIRPMQLNNTMVIGNNRYLNMYPNSTQSTFYSQPLNSPFYPTFVRQQPLQQYEPFNRWYHNNMKDYNKFQTTAFRELYPMRTITNFRPNLLNLNHTRPYSLQVQW